VNALALSAAVAALSDADYIDRTPVVLARERESFARRLEETGLLKVYPAAANFLLARIVRPGLTSGELARRLLERGFLVRDASSFSGLDERYVRLAVRSEADNAALSEALEEVGRR
jgi:threonine-phosphate decarboxylase